MDPMPFASFIVSRLLKPLPEFAQSERAVAETEIPIERDDWYWADDNAKVLELLSLPDIWRAYPEAVTDIVRFVCAMCDGPLIFRRISAPRLDVEANDGVVGRFAHSMMNITCNLKAGEVGLGMRFHDGRTARNVLFGGNYIRFGMAGQTYTVDAEAGIHHSSIEEIDGGVRLTWASRIEAKTGRFRNRVIAVGELTSTCTIMGASMFVDFETRFDPLEAVEVSDVVLTFGCDELSHDNNGIRYELASSVDTHNSTTHRRAGRSSALEIPLNGARYWSVTQTSHMSGFAAGVHSLPGDPARVKRVNGMSDRHSRLQWIVSEHVFEGPCKGRVTASERKIITAGGFYLDAELYADTFKRLSDISELGAPPIDLSVSYDYGAEINALARCLRTLSAPEPPLEGEMAEALRAQLSHAVYALMAAYDRYFIKPAHHDLSAVFSRSLSYVAFAHAEMFKLTQSATHSDALQEICGLIARFERPNTGIDGTPQSGFVMGTEVDALPFVDCHATCMLALVAGSEVLATNEWADAIDRGLAAFCLDTQKIFFLGDQKIDVVCVDFEDSRGNRNRTETFWNFKSGLCLQLFNALRATSNSALQGVWAKHRDRTELLEGWMRARIERSLRHHPDGIEVLTSVLSAETNSETQPWVALGMMD
jgi:hypothetical protein